MSKGKGGNRRIHTVADDRRFEPSTLDLRPLEATI